MQIGLWDNIYNFLIFIFWFRIWVDSNNEVLFNPYSAPLLRTSESLINTLKPVFQKTPNRVVALIILLFLIALRGLAMPVETNWILTMGFTRIANTTNLTASIAFSALSFFIFLFNIWSISLIYARSQGMPFNHTTGTLFCCSQPFTSLPRNLRPLALLLTGSVIAVLLNTFGAATSSGMLSLNAELDWANTPAALNITKLFIMALIGWTQVFMNLRLFLIALIVGSWISMFLRSFEIQAFCRDWIDFLLGPLRRYPLRLGPFDLSPIILFFALDLIYKLLMYVLVYSLEGLG